MSALRAAEKFPRFLGEDLIRENCEGYEDLGCRVYAECIAATGTALKYCLGNSRNTENIRVLCWPLSLALDLALMFLTLLL